MNTHLAKEGKIRLLCFVRSDVWNHRQSVRDLTKALKEDPALNGDQREKLANHPTLAMENAEAIIAFIDRVTKNAETMLATKGKATAPIANWISPFTTFSEIRQAIDPLITQGMTVREAAGRKALESQLHLLIQSIVPLINGKPLNPVNSVLNLTQALSVTGDELTQTMVLDKNQWTKLASLTAFSSRAEVDPAPLLPALGTDLLLRYDPASGKYQQTEEYDLLASVIDQARKLTKSGHPQISELAKYGRPIDRSERREVPAHIVVGWLHRLLRWVDLIGTARALARSLGGGPLERPPLIPRTPIVDQEAEVKGEAVSLAQVHSFVEEWAAEPPSEES
jgi:hypothetical protein